MSHSQTTKDSIDVLTPQEWQRWASKEIVRLHSEIIHLRAENIHLRASLAEAEAAMEKFING